jgi:hypothetical protein
VHPLLVPFLAALATSILLFTLSTLVLFVPGIAFIPFLGLGTTLLVGIGVGQTMLLFSDEQGSLLLMALAVIAIVVGNLIVQLSKMSFMLHAASQNVLFPFSGPSLKAVLVQAILGSVLASVVAIPTMWRIQA